LIVAAAIALRVHELGRLSFWYDEVVTLRLARAGSLSELLDLLFQIDATRAPLHPLALHAWISAFGHSEAAARSLSVICGVLTIIVIADLGRSLFDTSTGLWVAWLSAISPLMIVYSREARMYACLVLFTCLAWHRLLALRDGWSLIRATTYVIVSALMVYSHPLGLVMLATLALSGWVWCRSLFGTRKRWLITHLAVAAMILPWMRFYLDHSAEFLTGTLSVRFLLGTPIAFIGGNFVMLGCLSLLIIFGMIKFMIPRHARTQNETNPYQLAFGCLFLWFILPPLFLYAYSLYFQPIFGPARYSIYVAPAYLLLIAAGLSRLPVFIRYPVAAGLTAVAVLSLNVTVYAPGLKADWRGFSKSLADQAPEADSDPTAVVVESTGPGPNVEVETARYYLPPSVITLPLDASTAVDLQRINASRVFVTRGISNDGSGATSPPEGLGPYRFVQYGDFPGLLIYEGFR
jgi:mannosyltransferase